MAPSVDPPTRGLEIVLPPTKVQDEYERQAKTIEAKMGQLHRSELEFERAGGALTRRAFQGEL